MTDQPRTTLHLIKPEIGNPDRITFGYRITNQDGSTLKEAMGWATSAEALDAGAINQSAQESLEEHREQRARKGQTRP